MDTATAREVELVHWPAGDDRRHELRQQRVARLLLVEAGAPPPVVLDPEEDWVRIPAPETDIQARLDGLTRRLSPPQPTPPTLDDDGLLHIGEQWVSLPPVEARLAAALLERFRLVVSRDGLSRAGWPTGAPGRNALDVHVLRLRRRVARLGLAIRTVRSRGYLLEPAPPGE